MTIQTPNRQSSNSHLSHSQVSGMGKIIDTHCHLDFPVFDDDRDLILKNCQDNNIDAIVVPGVNHKNWQRVISLSRQYEIIHPALGLHPCFIHEHQADELDKLAQLCDTESLVAIGEIGLDFYDKKSQKKTRLAETQLWHHIDCPAAVESPAAAESLAERCSFYWADRR